MARAFGKVSQDMRTPDDGLSCPNPRERWLMAAGPPRGNCHRDEIEDPRTIRVCFPGSWPFKRYTCAILLVAACSTAPQLQRVADSMFEFGLTPDATAPYQVTRMIQPEPGLAGQ